MSAVIALGLVALVIFLFFFSLGLMISGFIGVARGVGGIISALLRLGR